MNPEKQSLIECTTKLLNRDHYLQLNKDVHFALHMGEPVSIEQSHLLRVYLCDILVATKMLAQANAIPDPPVKKSFWQKFK
jgi:hypothetical protein